MRTIQIRVLAGLGEGLDELQAQGDKLIGREDTTHEMFARNNLDRLEAIVKYGLTPLNPADFIDCFNVDALIARVEKLASDNAEAAIVLKRLHETENA